MAIDEALLSACNAGEGGYPVLRFYWWTVPTLSLGAKEKLEEAADPEACRRNGVALVRRSTGGRAVLHDLELTYSIVAAVGSPPFSGSVADSYRRIAEAMREGLLALGVALELSSGASERRGRGTHLPCFAAPSRCELAAGGRKVVGSAQRRLRNAVLQHGSILLRPQPGLLAVCTGLGEAGTTRMARAMAGLEELAGRALPREEVIEALLPPLEMLLGSKLNAGDLTESERATSARLLQEGRFEVCVGHASAISKSV